MRSWDESAVRRLITGAVPESVSLEYKSELLLAKPSERSEVAKDLSGIGNGGGGTVLYGVDEDTNECPVATSLKPLRDRTLQSRIEDTVADGVHPRLVVTYTQVELAEGGYVLAVHVESSPLGPYMVELYNDRRFYVRSGTSIRRMSEAEVSRAHDITRRSQDHRETTWQEHALPIAPPTADVWLTVAGIPQSPLSDLLDLTTVDPADLRPPDDLGFYLNQWEIADMRELFDSMARWSDGFHAETRRSTLGRLLRVHRDGSIGLALQIQSVDSESSVSLTRVSRIFNGALMYLGWVWARFGLGRPAELRARLDGCALLPFQIDIHDATPIVQPAGMTVATVEFADLVGVGDLGRLSGRHQICERFADRVAQAFGHRRANYPFRRGELYGRDGRPLRITIGESEIWIENAPAATIHSDGLVVAHSTGQPTGGFVNGVLTDDAGDVLGVLELAPGSGFPADFRAEQVERNPAGLAERLRNDPREPWVPLEGTDAAEVPSPSGRWSDKNVVIQIRGH